MVSICTICFYITDLYTLLTEGLYMFHVFPNNGDFSCAALSGGLHNGNELFTVRYELNF